ELWAESVRAAQGLFSSKAITLTQRIPQESFEIIADRDRLGFAFKEILSAAVKLSEAGSAITAEFSQGRQREVIVKITAKGSGIRAEALSGIFDHSTSTAGVSQTDKERQMNLSSVHDVIGKDGIEVLSNLKTVYPSIPIVILSGIGQIKTVVEAMKMGASDYLTKPFEEEALELAIQNAIEKHRLKEEVKTLKQQLAYVEQG